MESGDTIHEYVLAMTEEVNSIFGDPTMDYPLTDENTTIEFYDHETDPWELNNLADVPEHKERIETMHDN